jgi:hypothetical protein
VTKSQLGPALRSRLFNHSKHLSLRRKRARESVFLHPMLKVSVGVLVFVCFCVSSP